jgi:hypothetical protein
MPLVSGLLQLKHLDKYLRLIIWLAAASLVSDGVSFILINQGVNTWPIVNVFLIVQFSAMFTLLSHERKSVVLNIVFFACLAFALFDYAFLQTPRTFNSFTSYVAGMVIIVSALTYLYHLLIAMPVEKVQTLPLFWITFGALIYYGGTLFLFLFNNYLIAHLPERHQTIWILHNVLNITKNAFLFTAIWRGYKDKTYQS